jgi:hypothetical protein
MADKLTLHLTGEEFTRGLGTVEDQHERCLGSMNASAQIATAPAKINKLRGTLASPKPKNEWRLLKAVESIAMPGEVIQTEGV